jgi:hypothetical protein
LQSKRDIVTITPYPGIDMALNGIEVNRGILYDADVADACLRIFREKGFQLP